MKFLKILGIIVLALILIVVILALIAPKSYDVGRDIEINAEKELVFQQMQLWRNWGAWSPWAERDSTMKITIEGIDGQEGSKYVWKGDPKITGSGEITNTGVKPNEEMTYHLHFMIPWESESDGYVRVADADNGTRASWGFAGKYTIPMNILLLFMPMDKMMGPDFERGLALLKEVVESKASKMANLAVNETTYKSANYAAIRQQVKMSELESFYASSFEMINKAMESRGASMTGAPAGIFYSWEPEKGLSDMAAGIPVRRKVESDNVETINVPGGNALSIDFYGPYEEIELAHMVLMKYVQKNGLTLKWPMIEEYLTDPASVSDPNKWLTRVTYFVE